MSRRRLTLIPQTPRGALAGARGKGRRVARWCAQAYEHHKAGRLFDALPLYAKVLELDPRNAFALHYAALLTRTLSDHARKNGQPTLVDEAMRFMAMAVSLNPTNAAGVHNFAKLKHDNGELEDARQLYENAVALDPTQGESWTNLGNVYGHLGDREKAEVCWLRALECPTAAADARFNLSFLKLLKGDYANGWREYEARWLVPVFVTDHGRADLTAPRWDGAPIGGTLLLHQEQGAGDAIMMARYVPLAQERAGRVMLEVIAGLVPLFRAMFPGLEILERGEALPTHDAQLPMLSLPAAFGTTLETVPNPLPFWPDPAESSAPGSIEPEPGRIGLCWRGSATHVNDFVRSMPFEATFAMLDVLGLRWQSLQLGYETSDPIEPLPLGDFLETARQIARCELVVTVDTSIAHLAGSMGVPTWTLLPYHAEFRWLQDRDDSPWYRSMRIWRQERAGDWRGLAQRVAGELTRRYS